MAFGALMLTFTPEKTKTILYSYSHDCNVSVDYMTFVGLAISSMMKTILRV